MTFLAPAVFLRRQELRAEQNNTVLRSGLLGSRFRGRTDRDYATSLGHRSGAIAGVALASTGWTTQALATPHGVPTPRTGPELSDIALFVVAAIGVFLVRHALRKRFLKRPPKD